MQSGRAFCPSLTQRNTIATFGIKSQAMRITRCHFKARCKDQQVNGILDTINDDTALIDFIDAFSIGINKMNIGSIKRWQILVVETWALATLRVPRHHQFSRCRIFDHIGNALTNSFHVFKVNTLKFKSLFVVFGQLTSVNPVHLGPLIVNHVDCWLCASYCLSEVTGSFGLPTWLERLEPFWIGWFVVTNTHTRGGALKDEKVFRGFSQFWHNLNCRCTSSDNAHSLISKLLHQRL